MDQHQELKNPLKKVNRKISHKQLKELGYRLTDEQIPLGKKPYKSAIIEVKNEVGNKELSFCFLYLTTEKQGIILPNTFRYYQLRPNACYADLL